MGFGVHEVFDLLDLQASIFVGGDLCDVDRFASRINSDRGFYLIGALWVGARSVKQTQCGVNLESGIRTWTITFPGTSAIKRKLGYGRDLVTVN